MCSAQLVKLDLHTLRGDNLDRLMKYPVGRFIPRLLLVPTATSLIDYSAATSDGEG